MKHCLIADDSAVIRKVARRILEGLAFRITEAEDGAQALASCSSDMPDVILLDASMPGLDGYGVLKELRRMPEGSKPKVLFCTSENDVAAIARARHAGADEHLMKPFDKDLVAAKLQGVGLA